MKLAEKKTLVGKSVDELKGLVTELKKEQFNLRFQRAGGEAISGTRVRDVRRTIARALTLINQQKKDK